VASTGVAVRQEEWWTRERAAQELGCDLRKLRKLAQGGRIRRQHVPPGPGRPYQSVLYHAGDVVAYKAERAAGDGAPGLPWVRPAEAPASAMPQALALLAERLAPPVRVRRWLTLDEAVEYSGLPRAYLLMLTREGAPCVRDVSAGTRPRWRFDRDLL
jgi:hypothetical protein